MKFLSLPSFSLKHLNFRRKKLRTVLLLGLDSSGKTTLLTSLRPNLVKYGRDTGVDEVVTLPTGGVSLVEFGGVGGAEWRVWDLSGQGRFRR